jgi:tRNA pseudouridine(55) synthase
MRCFRCKILQWQENFSIEILEDVEQVDPRKRSSSANDKAARREALTQFVGDIEQVPPQYSAVYVDGKRAYKLARQGETVELEARPVYVESIELLESKPIICETLQWLQQPGNQ